MVTGWLREAGRTGADKKGEAGGKPEGELGEQGGRTGKSSCLTGAIQGMDAR